MQSVLISGIMLEASAAQARQVTVSIKYGAPSFVFNVYVCFHAQVCKPCFLAAANDMLVLLAVGLLHAH